MVTPPPHAQLHPHAAPAAALDLLSAAIAYARDHAADLVAQTWRHVGLAGGALLVVGLICVPAGVWIARHRRLAEPVIGLGSSLRVAPSFAMILAALRSDSPGDDLISTQKRRILTVRALFE